MMKCLWLLSVLVLVFVCVISAAENEPMTYVDGSGAVQTVTDYNILHSELRKWGGNTTYIVPKDGLTIDQKITVFSGTVNLILRDGATLNANNGITVPAGTTLNIFTESVNGTGRLVADATGDTIDHGAGIGGTQDCDSGIIRIHGGLITAKGCTMYDGGAGIGGGSGRNTGTIEIYGGIVEATGGRKAAGIGSGANGTGGNVSIYGGTVRAVGGSNAAGIGA